MTKFHKTFVSTDFAGHRGFCHEGEVINYVVAKSATRRVVQTAIAGCLVAAIVAVSIIALAPTAKSNENVGYSKANIHQMHHLVKKVIKA